MVDFKKAVDIAKNHSDENEELRVAEAYEGNNFYLFALLPEDVEEIDDMPLSYVDKKTGEYKDVYGPEIGKLINNAEEIPSDEIEAMLMFF